MTNTFLEKPCKKCGGATIPRPLLKKLKLRISLNQQSEVSVCFYCITKSKTTET